MIYQPDIIQWDTHVGLRRGYIRIRLDSPVYIIPFAKWVISKV